MYFCDPYRFDADMFSFGVIVFRLLSGKAPFPSRNPELLQLHTEELQYSVSDSDWEGRSEASKDFVHKLLTRQEDRMTAEEALAHPWFREPGHSILPPDVSYSGASNAMEMVSLDGCAIKAVCRGQVFIHSLYACAVFLSLLLHLPSGTGSTETSPGFGQILDG